MFNCILHDQFFKDLAKLKSENSKYPSKILDLINSIYEHPNDPLGGIGKSEYLKHDLAGFLSRRIVTSID